MTCEMKEKEEITPLGEGKTCEMKDGKEAFSSAPKQHAETFEFVKEKEAIST